MRITVCELPGGAELDAAWDGLVAHCASEGSHVVVLPEMPFAPWLPAGDEVDQSAWDDAVAVHERWLGRLPELGAELVLGTHPVVRDGDNRNEAFVWSDAGVSSAHTKYYLPNEAGFWEARWYQRAPDRAFDAARTDLVTAGFLICSEVWFTEHARAYARQGVELLAVPRATERATRDRWLVGGRAAAIMSGAFCASSNRTAHSDGIAWGGRGWIIDPDGEVLGSTTEDEPFLTRDVDLDAARHAKTTYPRYVRE